MQPLTTPEVVAELRASASAKKKRVDGRRFRVVAVSSLVAALLLDGVLLWFGVYDVKLGGTVQLASGRAYVVFFIAPLIYWLVLSSVFDAAARKMHILAPSGSINADTATTAELVRWLEVKSSSEPARTQD